MPTGKIFWVVIIFCIATVIAGCGSWGAREDIAPVDSKAESAPEVTTTPTPTLLKEIIEPASPISPLLPAKEPAMAEPLKGSGTALAAAKADLAKQTGTPVEEIGLISIEAVDWSDTSLGCPQEGFMYAQVITPGYLMVLEAADQQYEYHTDQTTNVVLCQ
ncbi:MAG: hypothetical protein JXM69_19545 [Anaerolineae bacterium]|nr:hypothetical protein [Anaerolineae bacterium]